MNFKYIILPLLLCCLTAGAAFSQERNSSEQNDDIVIKVRELPSQPIPSNYVSQVMSQFRTKGGGGPDEEPKPTFSQEYMDEKARIDKTKETTGKAATVLENIVNTGKKVYNLIRGNDAVLTETIPFSTALPQRVLASGENASTEFMLKEMAGWEFPPREKSYEIVITGGMFNWFDVAKIKYQILYTYGGSYNGKGKYLTGVAVQPVRREISSGTTVNISCIVPDLGIYNVGTAEDPVAAMNIAIKIDVTGKGATTEYSTFVVTGRGEFSEVAMGNSKPLIRTRTQVIEMPMN